MMILSQVNGITLGYSDTGSGEPVVMVMGMGGSGRIWHTYQVPELVSAGYRVITIENRGIAPSDICADGFSLDDMVEDVGALLDHLGIDSCRFVGVSLGSIIIQELLLKRPQLAECAVLMASFGRFDKMRQAMHDAERSVDESQVELPPRHHAVMQALENLSPQTLNDEAAIGDWLELFELSIDNGPGLKAQRLTLSKFNRLSAYQAITARCLVIAFEDDIIAPPRLGLELANTIPNSRYRSIPDCGHYGYLERSEDVNKEIVAFLAQSAADEG